MGLKFITPANIMIIGPSLSGKSTMMFNILAQKSDAFDKLMGRIYYCYGTFSEQYNKIKKQLGNDIEFFSGIPTEEMVRKWASASKGLAIILVLDDLMEQISKSVTCQDLVTKITHHCEMALFILTQNMFQKGPIFRCVSLNTHYFIIMKTKRDQQQLLHFGRQIFPFKTNYLYDSYIKATEAKQYGALRVDLHPASDSRLVLTSDFLSDHPVVYLEGDRSDDIIHLRMI